MRKHSFFFKLLAGYLLLVAAIIAVLGLLAFHWLGDFARREGATHQDRILHAATVYFEHVWAELPPAPASRQAEHRTDPRIAAVDPQCRLLMAGSPTDLRLTVIDDQGWVLGDSASDPREMVNHQTSDRPEVLDALVGRPGRDVRRSDTKGIEYRYFAAPIRQNGQVVGLVRVAMPASSIAAGGQLVGGALLWAAAAAAVLAVMLGLLVSWLWYAPLRQISHAARRIASGNLAHRLHLTGSDELAELSRALNDMRSSLAEQIQTIATQREYLQTVVANMHEGLIAADAGGRRSCSPAAKGTASAATCSRSSASARSSTCTTRPWPGASPPAGRSRSPRAPRAAGWTCWPCPCPRRGRAARREVPA